MVVFEYIDWTQRISTQKISSVRLELDASKTELDLTKKLNDFTMQVTGLSSRPDIWPEPNPNLPGFEIIFSFLSGQPREIDIALSSLGVLAISIADATVSDSDVETAARRIDNYSVIVSHLVRRCLGERVNSREIEYQGGSSVDGSNRGYHVHRTDALPIPIGERRLGDPDNRAATLLHRNTLPSREVRQDRNTEARSTVSNALVALTQRRLRLRDKVMAAVERYSESYVDSFATAGLYSNLVTSSLALCGILFGILFSDTLFGFIGPIETYFTQSVSLRSILLCVVILAWVGLLVSFKIPENDVVGTKLFLGTTVATGLIFSVVLVLLHLQNEKELSLQSAIVFIWALALWCSATLLLRRTMQLFERTARSDYRRQSRSSVVVPRLLMILIGFLIGVSLPGLVGYPLFPGCVPVSSLI